MNRRCTFFLQMFREIIDNQLYRMQNSSGPGRLGVEIIPQTAFQRTHVDPAIGFGHSDPFTEKLDGFRRVAPATDTDDRRHPRIVPAIHDFFFHQLQQFPLAGYGIGQVQPRKFILVR